MKILAIDPGAERCGWAILEPGPNLIESGVMRCHRDDKEEFQKYRLRLEEHAAQYFEELLDAPHYPSEFVNETVPAVGGGNFVVATQSYLANCVVTTVHVCAFKRGVKVFQQGATTVHKNIGVKGRTGKVTKVGVRNGVITILPDLARYVSDQAWPWDRWDAIANGLSFLGYRTSDFMLQ